MSTNIGLPNISVVFKEAAQNAGIRLSQSKVAIAISETGTNAGLYQLKSTQGIPNDISQTAADFVGRAFQGAYGRTPQIVYLSVNSTIADALTALEKRDFDWICGLSIVTTTDEDEGTQISIVSVSDAVKTWTTAQRAKGKLCKAVVADPVTTTDEDHIVALHASGITLTDGTVLTADLYTSRLAGLLACMPLSQSCTYFDLTDLKRVNDEADITSIINNGKLVLINDGEVVRIARGVTANTGTSGEHKIKLVCAKDKIRRELEKSIKDGFVGKMPCTYDNKCILIAAIKSYLDTLTKLGVLTAATVEIDIDEQTNYLAQQGIDTSTMPVQEIKEADTGDNVFIAISCTLLDAMENFTINITV